MSKGMGFVVVTGFAIVLGGWYILHNSQRSEIAAFVTARVCQGVHSGAHGFVGPLPAAMGMRVVDTGEFATCEVSITHVGKESLTGGRSLIPVDVLVSGNGRIIKDGFLDTKHADPIPFEIHAVATSILIARVNGNLELISIDHH
ncbi:MAG: hypothetical protein ABIW82_17315 [Dokdonella sp.]